jgi:hypothetical protein
VSITEYFARRDSRLTEADAKVIGPEIEKLGAPTAEEVVDAARSTASPLHPYFEWNDTVAAVKYRLEQAREIIRAIVIRTDEEEEMRAFLPVQTQKPGGEDEPLKRYTPVQVIREKPDMAAQVLEDALAQLRGWQRRYSVYRSQFPTFEAKLGSLFDAVEELDAAA